MEEPKLDAKTSPIGNTKFGVLIEHARTLMTNCPELDHTLFKFHVPDWLFNEYEAVTVGIDVIKPDVTLLDNLTNCSDEPKLKACEVFFSK